MQQELIIFEDGEVIKHDSEPFLKETLKSDLLEKTLFSLETDSCLGEKKTECTKKVERKLSLKRQRNSKEKPILPSERKRLRLSKEKDRRSSVKKRKNSIIISSFNNDETSRKLSDVPKKSEISSNSTFDNLQKNLKQQVDNKFSSLNQNKEQFKTSIDQLTKKNINIKNFAIKTIKLSLDKLKTNKDKDSSKENLNLFEILKETKIETGNNDIVMLDIIKNPEIEKDKKNDGKKEEFVTPNKLNFYQEHSKRFYKNDSNQKDDIEIVKQLKLIEESPFKAVTLPEGLLSPNNCIYLYSYISKAFIFIGFFGIVILMFQDKSINDSIYKFLYENWQSISLITVSIMIMVYYFQSKLDKDYESYKESVAKMIIENMKIVLENEKTNNPDIHITEEDIFIYFSYHLKLSEEFISKNIIPLIRKIAAQDICLVEESENVNEKISSRWRLANI